MPEDQTPQTPNNNQNPPPAPPSGGGFDSSSNQKSKPEELDFGTVSQGSDIQKELIKKFRFRPQDGGRNIPNQNINLNNLKPLKSFVPNAKEGGSSRPQNLSARGFRQGNESSLPEQEIGDDQNFENEFAQGAGKQKNNQPEDLKNQKKLDQENGSQQVQRESKQNPQTESLDSDASIMSESGKADAQRLSEKFAENDAKMIPPLGIPPTEAKQQFQKQQTENFNQPKLGTMPNTGEQNRPRKPVPGETGSGESKMTSSAKSEGGSPVKPSPTVAGPSPSPSGGTPSGGGAGAPGVGAVSGLASVAASIARGDRPDPSKVLDILQDIPPLAPFIRTIRLVQSIPVVGWIAATIAGFRLEDIVDDLVDVLSSTDPRSIASAIPKLVIKLGARVARLIAGLIAVIIINIVVYVSIFFFFVLLVLVVFCQVGPVKYGSEIIGTAADITGSEFLTKYSFCRSINTAYTNVASFGGGGVIGGGGGSGSGGGGTVGGGGACKRCTSGVGSVEYLQNTCLGPNAEIGSYVASAESSCGNNLISGSDVCVDGNSVSFGLFQINISANPIGGLNCPSAFNKPFTAEEAKKPRDKRTCRVVNPDLYNQCRTLALDTSNNIQYACQILDRKKSRGQSSWYPTWGGAKCVHDNGPPDIIK